MWHLLPENWLFENSCPLEVCKVILGSLLPAQEGGELPAVATRPEDIDGERGSASML